MKRFFRICMITLLLGTFLSVSAGAKATEIDYAGEGAVFGKTSYVYHRIDVKFTDYYKIFGVYGFTTYSKYWEYISSCHAGCDDGYKTMNRRYAYTLCDKNKKNIDPAGWHKPGKSAYRYGYFLKKGTYYLKIKTNRKKCGQFLVKGYLISTYTAATESSYRNQGGKRKTSPAGRHF